jgi:hypothetical protein
MGEYNAVVIVEQATGTQCRHSLKPDNRGIVGGRRNHAPELGWFKVRGTQHPIANFFQNRAD